jgi:spermidine/putrescine transport system ATP-binding protein
VTTAGLLDTDAPATTAPSPAAAPTLLSLVGVTKRFGEHVAVRPVDLDIAAGEFVTLLGPSGCGKTTLLRMIAGLEEPSGGRIVVDGRDITAVRPERRPFNMVFQSYALFPHLDVFDNVAYGLRAAGMAEEAVAVRVRAALAMVGLETQGRKAVDQLSGGMSQRVALVRAIVNEPKVLLLDEPLAALDLQLRKRMQVELRAIQERIGTTFIHVTHDQEEALVMSDRIVVMQAGDVVQVGAPRDVYQHPRTRFVAEFVGETALLDCIVEAEAGPQVTVRFPNGHSRTFLHYGLPGLEPGAAGLVSLRPQHLALTAPGEGLFDGHVANVLFTGTTTEIVVDLVTGGRVRAQLSPSDNARRGSAVGLRALPGCGVFVRAEDKPARAEAPGQ